MIPLITVVTAFETIGSIVGVLITLITFLTLITKRPIQAFRKLIREESRVANNDLKKELEETNSKIDENNERIKEIEGRIKDNDETDLAILRNTITHIYYKYKDAKEIPFFEKENVMKLYERYEAKGGNSFIHTIVQDITEWKVI